jgi:hypothetical protein
LLYRNIPLMTIQQNIFRHTGQQQRPFQDKAIRVEGGYAHSIHVRASACDIGPVVLQGTHIHGIHRCGNANARARSLRDDFDLGSTLVPET